MYRWFLRHFPRGGSYADIHHALIEEGYTDWAESLVEYAWKKWLADENFAHQEVSSMQKLATDPGERLFCSQFARSDDHDILASTNSAGDYTLTNALKGDGLMRVQLSSSDKMFDAITCIKGPP